MLDSTQSSTPHSASPPSSPNSESIQIVYLLGPRSPRDWLRQALENPKSLPAGSAAFQVVEVPSLAVCLERLRSQPFDVIMIDCEMCQERVTELFSTFRATAGDHISILVLDEDPARRQAADCLDAGATAYISLRSTTSRELVHHLRQAVHHGQRDEEISRLRAWHRRQQQQDEQETKELLGEQLRWVQTEMLEDSHLSQATTPCTSTPCTSTLASLERRGLELLQSFALLDAEHLVADIDHFARSLAEYYTHPTPIISLMTQLMESLLPRKGARSARHIYARSHLLLLRLLTAWAHHVARLAKAQPSSSTAIPMASRKAA